MPNLRAMAMGALLAASVTMAATPAARAAESALDPGLRDKAEDAVNNGLRFLRNTQKPDGSWRGSVGITALALRAFLESYRGYNESDGAFIARPIAFILSKVQKNGAISEGIVNTSYNTATAMFALAATHNPKYKAVLSGAQGFLKTLQIDEGEGYDPSHRYFGGIGYGDKERPDLSNMYLALEGMHASALDPKDPVWARAVTFISRCQNRSESNDQAWASNDGGFTYMPGGSAWTKGTESYGSMTGAGLIGLIFAGIDKSDPRIQAAWKWIAENYTVDENPGVSGRRTIFYYYEVLSKVMYAMGQATIKDGSGQEHNWRNDLVAKLVSLQDKDGSWVNHWSGAEWEGIKELITARSVIALNLAMRE